MLKTSKKNKMKLAIPTNDGLTINKDFTLKMGFLVSTIQFGEVVEQEMRWNLNNEILGSESSPYKEIVDCNKVIVSEISSNQNDFLRLKKIDVIKTNETIVTKILIQFLQNLLHKESNTCCCP